MKSIRLPCIFRFFIILLSPPPPPHLLHPPPSPIVNASRLCLLEITLGLAVIERESLGDGVWERESGLWTGNGWMDGKGGTGAYGLGSLFGLV